MKNSPVKKLSPTEIYRFFQKVARSDGPNACWPWKGKPSENGYGIFTFKGKSYKAHRIAYYLEYAHIKTELMVLHKCDVRLCCNPAHLYQGHAKQNTQDAVRRGRHTRMYGEQNGKAKLTKSQVKAIRKRYRQGGVTQKSLARDYGVSETTIFYVCSGERWIKLAE
jgi:hypothetical protein